MVVIAAIAGWILIAAALAGAAYAFAAAHAVGVFFRHTATETADSRPVTILKPLHGPEPLLFETLESFACQDYPSDIQIVFGVQRTDDPAVLAVNQVKALHPDLDIALSVSRRSSDANPKIGNLIAMLPSARHEVLVLSDSDIAVAPDYLRNVVGALAAPGVGAVTCCYRGRPLDNVWSRLSAMSIDYQFLPGVVFGLAHGLAHPCFGSTIALKKSMLAGIGGFEAFRDRLADDYEIGKAIREKGYKIAVPPLTVTHTCAESSLAALLSHELRWARTIRAVGGAGYAGSGVTHAFPLAILGAACLGFSYTALCVIAATMIARLYLKHRIDRILHVKGAASWLLPLRDVISFLVFAGSFFAVRVDWRGEPYRVHSDGALARE